MTRPGSSAPAVRSPGDSTPPHASALLTATPERSGWRLRFAAERIVERVFQAAQALGDDQRERYFGGAGFRALRGMRNRLAHNYLDVDADVLWDAIAVDLPEVQSFAFVDSVLAAHAAPAAPAET